MQLIKLGNQESKPVKSYKDIEAIVPEFLEFIDSKNGHFNGMHSTCFALGHCQVCEDCFSFFVVSKDWTKGTEDPEAPKDQLFPHRVIINPRIIEVPEKVKKVINVENKATKQMQKEEVLVKNIMRVEEGCMSFPFKRAKNMDRYFEIKVEYQIPSTLLGFTRLKTVRETVKGLKAHIFQHECDHMQGINMYYGKRIK